MEVEGTIIDLYDHFEVIGQVEDGSLVD